MSFPMPAILCTQIVPVKSVAFEGVSQILSAALISRSDSFFAFILFERLSFGSLIVKMFAVFNLESV